MEELNDAYIRSRVGEMKWYAPISLGAGIVTRPWNWPDAPVNSPHMGPARFEFILRRNLPDLQGKRVLDLGCNAGLMSLHMARCGAREVVGMDSEKTWPGWQEQAAFVKRVLEWRCATSYNVAFVEANMRDLPSLDLGAFDVVVALCCLYYLDPHDIDRVIGHVANGLGASCCLLQGNIIRADHAGRREVERRARPRYLRDVLLRHGYRFVSVDAPWFYGRPVVVGRTERSPIPRYGLAKRTIGRLLRKASYLPHLFQEYCP
ncbi:MAG: class I SAM-dependent methyltransferase [Pirellulales bacterium]|nr:class I SAM-dependent methyltransferase [Pirellulales bacterium]